MSAMNYKGYFAAVSFKADDAVFVGRISGIRDQVVFEGKSVPELKAAFERAVNEYLATCAEHGCDPEKPNSGRLMFRVDPALHARVTMAADAAGVSLSQWAGGALARAADADFAKEDIPSRQHKSECSIHISSRIQQPQRSAKKWIIDEIVRNSEFYEKFGRGCIAYMGCSFLLLLCVVGLIPSFSVLQFDQNPKNCIMASVSHHYLWRSGFSFFMSIAWVSVSWVFCVDGTKFLRKDGKHEKESCGGKGFIDLVFVLIPVAISVFSFAKGAYFLTSFMGHIGQPAIAQMTAPMENFVCPKGK
ncbi:MULTISPECIES: type II toxin-antitoxin system HicB family antitoxin [Asaia]|uniref:type II toxin-antitoxin system HicB family antitoxin n=1 Tax=Asaia TaxID=91914 RepID=UPI002FC2AC23